MLKEQFLRVWENFAPPPGIRPSFFAPGQGIRQKNLPGWPEFVRSKKFSPGLSGGGCTQLELTETLVYQYRGFNLINFAKTLCKAQFLFK